MKSKPGRKRRKRSRAERARRRRERTAAADSLVTETAGTPERAEQELATRDNDACPATETTDTQQTGELIDPQSDDSPIRSLQVADERIEYGLKVLNSGALNSVFSSLAADATSASEARDRTSAAGKILQLLKLCNDIGRPTPKTQVNVLNMPRPPAGNEDEATETSEQILDRLRKEIGLAE